MRRRRPTDTVASCAKTAAGSTRRASTAAGLTSASSRARRCRRSIAGRQLVHQHPSRVTLPNRLIAARAAPDGRRITLLNRELKLRDRHGVAETQVIDSTEALRKALAQHFGLHFPEGTKFGEGPAPWPT